MVELAPLLPIVAPFLIGLFLGMVIKRGIKLIFPVIALIATLVFTGVIGFGFGDIFTSAAQALPQIVAGAGTLVNLLPYTSISFLVGAVLGFFKG